LLYWGNEEAGISLWSKNILLAIENKYILEKIFFMLQGIIIKVDTYYTKNKGNLQEEIFLNGE
jgi:transposase